MTTVAAPEKIRRERLSIDLEAYPDVKEMLADAVAATGDTPTTLTIQALRDKLPQIVHELSRIRAEKAAEFTRKYGTTSLGGGGAKTRGAGSSEAAKVLNAAVGKKK